ncbi:alanine--tRNA ligase [Streptomyces sp. H27-H1]|uniref:alanine--tRNA ligase n=1 Tax=Streptomyces sp. H27-H1 TaxID=2996461 RepID=UPI00226F353B|nr:alanine--tRNA ligase [Streptomyces sp. H27-H1]MCY0924887.1 alanine--tRNA ligase [Streptomyces sp. H27-H1]
MHSQQIRSTFLDFFTARGHELVRSSPLVPDDPTLLLANAGMNQFKPYYLGESPAPYPRAVSVQKCARTSDIENVGRTARHGTFFEMLGNFSFGDYFKQETIAYAYELVTRDFGLDPERLWATVYLDDDESIRCWEKVGIPTSRIQRLGKEDNFWSMGVPGPCGPNSELYYDRGPAFGRDGGPAVNDERYMEIWNLVFMQFGRGEGEGKTDYPILGELPMKGIDTGMGLERLALLLQDVENVCQTDLLAPTLHTVQELAGRGYPGSGAEKVSFQVVTEHARAMSFLIADGVLPGNEGRGYVLRRLMRRAVRHGRLLGIDGPVLPAVTGSVIANLGTAWPELAEQADLIEQITRAEEESFGRTLRQGAKLLDAAVRRAKEENSGTLSGETAFELHDTFGFPVELTLESAHDAGLAVDEDRFKALLAAQQQRAKSGGKAKTAAALRRQEAYRELVARHGRTEFLGYERTTAEGTVLAVLDEGSPVAAASAGQQIELILDATPFYAERGGQVGDTGELRTADGTVLEITDTRNGLPGFHVHTARVVEGEIRSGQTVEAAVDAVRRSSVARSHSATHVLHAVVREVLGKHAVQHGSLVDDGRLRFDFVHFSALSQSQLEEIEARVNQRVLADPEVRVWHADRAEAERAGALALFGEKYEDTVRIVDIGDFSRELCGGTHVAHGAQVGAVRLAGDVSVGANLRRIEAWTGFEALASADRERQLLRELAGLLGSRPEDAVGALRKRLELLARAQGEVERMRGAELTALAAGLAEKADAVPGGLLVATRVEGVTAQELRQLASTAAVRIASGAGIVVLGTAHEGKAMLASAVGARLRERGIEAREVLSEAAAVIGGGAGGKGALASAGGRHADRLGDALSLARAAAATVLGRSTR